MDSTHDSGLCCSTLPACHDLLAAGQLLTQISHLDIDIRNTRSPAVLITGLQAYNC